MRRKIGTSCMILGAILVLAALLLFAWNQWEDHRADAAASGAMAEITSYMASAETAAPAGNELPTVEIDGYSYIGYLSIPRVNLELPVMADWSYDQLKIAPCRYYGSPQTQNMVIAGHNYTRHFGPLENLKPGDSVIFTDMNGTAYPYEVAEVDTLQPTAVTEMVDSGFALSLFTCNYSGQARVTVRCTPANG